MKKILFYAVLIYLLPATTYAGRQNDGHHNGPVSDYVKTHVMPVVTEKRQAFDALLSATEKNELASLREQLQQLNKIRKNAMVQKQESTDGDWTANRETRHENRAKMKELMAQVQIIADNHKDQLDKIFNTLAPQKDQWKSDIAKIVTSQRNAAETNSSSLADHPFLHYDMNGKFKMWSRNGFLLLDPSKTVAREGENQENALTALSSGTMSLYPNPAANEFLLNLSGVPAENKLIVTDMTGKVMFEKENVMPSEAIACNQLDNGMYFVSLCTPGMSINQKLIISH